MHQVYDHTAVPQLISFGLNKDLLAKAKKLNLDLAKELERFIIQEITKAEKDEWLKQNLQMVENLQRTA